MRIFNWLFGSKKASGPSNAAIDLVSNVAVALKWGDLYKAENILNKQSPAMLQQMLETAEYVCSSPRAQGDIDLQVWKTVLSMIQKRV